MGIEWQRDWGEQVSRHTPDLQGRSHHLQLIVVIRHRGMLYIVSKAKPYYFRGTFAFDDLAGLACL